MLACKANKGVLHIKLPSEGYRAVGGVCNYSIARYRAKARHKERVIHLRTVG